MGGNGEPEEFVFVPQQGGGVRGGEGGGQASRPDKPPAIRFPHPSRCLFDFNPSWLPSVEMSEVTLLLDAAKAGEPGADERLWEVVYDELRRKAGELMTRENREVTLSGTALLHEAWLRLTGPDGAPLEWDSRSHFFSAASEAMRRILVDRARARLRQKRGGGSVPADLEFAAQIAAPDDAKLLMVHEILDELMAQHPQRAQIVKLRFFVGFTHDETAALLGISEKTVRREWKLAKTWLFRSVKGLDILEPLTDE